jgi:hypothetical protein
MSHIAVLLAELAGDSAARFRRLETAADSLDDASFLGESIQFEITQDKVYGGALHFSLDPVGMYEAFRPAVVSGAQAFRGSAARNLPAR